MNASRYEAVIFDCDGVLVDSEVLAIRGERRVLGEMGLHYTPAEYVRQFVGLHDDAFIDAVRVDYRSVIGEEPPADLGDQVIAGRRDEMGALKAIDGAAAAMRTVIDLEKAIAVASSSRAHFLERKLKKTALWEHASPHVYSADLVAQGKPAPDIFIFTAEKLGIDPERCLVIEDSENGVKAGVAAGMTVWGFLGGGHCYDGHGDRLRDAGAADLVENFVALAQALAHV